MRFLANLQDRMGHSFGGRFVELVLEDLCRDHTDLSAVLFNVPLNQSKRSTGGYSVVAEWGLPDRNRIADLALIDALSGEPLALAEIKYDDHKNPKNAAQLKDYVEFCRKRELGFCYLTQHYPPSSDLAKVRGIRFRHLLFSDLAAAICARRKLLSDRSIGLLIEYLEDRGLLMKTVDGVGLRKLMVRIFNPNHGQGRQQANKDIVTSVPESFATLLSNVQLLGDEIAHLIQNRRRPAVDFEVEPYGSLSKKKLRDISNGQDDRSSIFFTKAGGALWVFFRITLTDGIGMAAGYVVEISSPIKRDEPSVSLYAAFWGRNLAQQYRQYSRIATSVIGNKKKCLKTLTRLISEEAAVAAKDPEASRKISKVFGAIAKATR
jgi:hypothetical protein